MPKIVVFDSGLGSISIIKAIQKQMKSEIIYFADQKNFPYGQKSVKTLRKIILNRIRSLKETFTPDLIVVASNTPSLLLQDIFKKNKTIIGILPPIKQAKKISKQTICILSTKSVISNKLFQKYINKENSSNTKIIAINASPLVELVESGKIFSQKKYCKIQIKKTLSKQFLTHNVDVVTLSSTHLPFLLPFFKELFPRISFVDPANLIAKQISNKLANKPSFRNKLRIYSSGSSKRLKKNLNKLHIQNDIQQLSF